MMTGLRIILVSLVVLFGSSSLQAVEETPVTFLGVALDPETQEADRRLREFIKAQQAVKFEIRDQEYGAAINTLMQWNEAEQGPLIARVTPYVYVVAEMLGADLEILATYLSKKTDELTYHSYLVMHRDTYAGNDLDTFVKLLRDRQVPARFIYHNKFSTSSYFLPSLYFRQHDIFSVSKNTNNNAKYITIHAERPDDIGGSSSLVGRVKNKQADFAAVWTGTKAKFDQNPDLNFLKLPQTLPNDLLVISRTTDEKLKDELRQSINKIKPEDVNIGDFLTWVDFNKTPDARRALASLRWLAKIPPHPIPLKIRKPHNKENLIQDRYLEAARQAVRLSGTEFVLFDEDFHKHFDVLWTLEQTHDDSLIITSEFMQSKLPSQKFHISFKKDDMESLVTRIGSEISNNMHRIRFVWPFDNAAARVLRDVEFSIPKGTAMKGMKITWSDQSSNAYTSDTPFDVVATESGFHSFELEGAGFPVNEGHYNFDPMSNSNYRVFLVRPKPGGQMLKIVSYVLLVLFALAAMMALKAAFLVKRRSNMEKALLSKTGLILILVGLFVFNFAETQLEVLFNGGGTFDQGFKIAQAFDQMEGLIRFNDHAQPPIEAISGLSLSYFVLFPLLLFGTALALGFRRQLRPFRVYTLSLTFNYFLSLPFFLFFPVPERWTYPASNAVLLSDMLSTKLIELIRPISGLDNSFPSVHVAFSIITLLVAYRYRLQYRHAIACIVLTVILATFALGIHWIPDLIMGDVVMAVMAFGLAIVFDRRYEDVVSAVPITIEKMTPQVVPEPIVENPLPLVQEPTAETPPPTPVQAPTAKAPDHQVFISYRRELGSDLARNISLAMQLKGISCFLDVDDLGARHFDKRLLREIEATPNFVVILTPGALDNCQTSNDWLRKEIGHAILCKCNIVPLLIDGFSFPDAETLPEDLRDLVRHNGVSHSHEYFDASINKLQHFLSLD